MSIFMKFLLRAMLKVKDGGGLINYMPVQAILVVVFFNGSASLTVSFIQERKKERGN